MGEPLAGAETMGPASIRPSPRSVPPEVLQDPLRRELAWRAHDASTRVRAGAALVVAVDRRSVLAPARCGSEEIHLRRQELTGEDVALAESDRPFDVERRHDLPMQHKVGKAREERL